ASAGRARAGDGLRAAPSLIGAGPRRAGATGRYGSAAPDARAHRGAGTRLALTALGVVAVGVGPVALGAPHALYDNVVRFPLGLGELASPADSPLPGRLLATHVDGGAGLAVALLASAAVAVAGSLAVRPPRTVRAAADRLAVGLGAAMLLMPASRFGYLVYPLVLWAVPRCADRRQGVRA
ncbi:hypothetical protein M4J07_000438, partial [Streptomyces longispororuber]|nr:hypothetical protein [Streptomyces longispororuber]